MRAAIKFINALTKFYAFVKMSMSRDRRNGLPNHNNFSPIQGGIIVASAFTFITFGSYIGAWISLVVLGFLWVLLENKNHDFIMLSFLNCLQRFKRDGLYFHGSQQRFYGYTFLR